MFECPITGIVILRPQVKLKSYKPLLYLCFCTRVRQHVPSLFSFPNSLMHKYAHIHVFFSSRLSHLSHNQSREAHWSIQVQEVSAGFLSVLQPIRVKSQILPLINTTELVPHYRQTRNERAAQTVSVENMSGPSTACLCINISILICAFSRLPACIALQCIRSRLARWCGQRSRQPPLTQLYRNTRLCTCYTLISTGFSSITSHVKLGIILKASSN